MKKPEYLWPNFLLRSWRTAHLAALSDGELSAMAGTVRQFEKHNQQCYDDARSVRKRAQAEFRSIHSRAPFPAQLKRPIQKPPDLSRELGDLVKRRRAYLLKEARGQNEAQVIFLDRMDRGRLQAMRARERAIRQMINEQAALHAIPLTERAIDKRLAELFANLHISTDRSGYQE